jgi:hypothetical protein
MARRLANQPMHQFGHRQVDQPGYQPARAPETSVTSRTVPEVWYLNCEQRPQAMRMVSEGIFLWDPSKTSGLGRHPFEESEGRGART